MLKSVLLNNTKLISDMLNYLTNTSYQIKYL